MNGSEQAGNWRGGKEVVLPLCSSGDCHEFATAFAWLHDCDCRGDEETFPNCMGHPYCEEHADALRWREEGSAIAGSVGCIRCSSSSSIVSHGPGRCDNDPERPVNVIAAHFKAKNPDYIGIVWEAIANGAVRALEDAGYRIEKVRD